ncbi:MAG: MlaD family protein [Cyanobacteria bacterium P01_F01_bin.42]
MRSRAVKEGAVGLLLLGGLGLLAGSIFWIRGTSFQGQSYRAEVDMPNALGLNPGSAVHYRGVKVGKITQVMPTTNGVRVGFQIQPSTLLIPRTSIIETSQSGFVGQVVLMISPDSQAPQVPQDLNLTPFDENCDASLIVCDGDRLVGQAGSSFDDLIRSTTKIATLLGEGQLLQNTNVTLRNLSQAAVSFRNLSRNATTTLGSLNQVSKTAGSTLTEFGQLSQDARRELNDLGEVKTSIQQAVDSVSASASQFGEVGDRFIQTAEGIDGATSEIGSLLQNNRGEIVATLQNLNAASEDLKVIVSDLSPIIGQVNESELVANLDRLVANGAEATESLKAVTATAGSPLVLLEIAETLGAARTTFQNTQKITTDLEELTGNTEFRDNLLRLINGLSKLVSSADELQRQYNLVQYAQATELTESQSLTPPQFR